MTWFSGCRLRPFIAMDTISLSAVSRRFVVTPEF
jgi:hypothetical protein